MVAVLRKRCFAVIVRSWRGRASPETAEKYLRHLQRTVFPELRVIKGHRGEYVLRRGERGGVEFVVLTLWDSMDAIREFAGKDPESAVVPPEARALLTEFDERVNHYEAVVAPP